MITFTFVTNLIGSNKYDIRISVEILLLTCLVLAFQSHDILTMCQLSL